MTTWRQFYAPANQGNRFAVKGPFYGPQGHRGQDYRAAPHQAIPTYVKARCVLNGHSSVLGNYTVLRSGLMFYGWAHLLIGSRPDVGDVLKPGDIVGKAAGANDDHGSAWSGSHCHTTRGLTLMHIVYGAVLNPVTAIKKALAKK